MLPDLRFIIGAALVTALLCVTVLGLTATVRLAQEARSGTVEANRPLAYSNGGDLERPSPGVVVQRPGGPFANMPAGGVMTAPAPIPTAENDSQPAADDTTGAIAQADVTSEPPADAADIPDDHANVDERAVVDPPLLPGGEPLPDTAAAPVADPAPTAQVTPPETLQVTPQESAQEITPEPAPEQPSTPAVVTETQPAEVDPTAVTATPVENEVTPAVTATPTTSDEPTASPSAETASPLPENETAAAPTTADTPPEETAAAAPQQNETAPAAAPAQATTASIPAAVDDAPLREAAAPAMSDREAAAPAMSDPDTAMQESAVTPLPPARRNRAGKAKARAKAKALRPAPKAQRRAVRAGSAQVIPPTASTGYPVTIERTARPAARANSIFPFGE